MTDRIQKIYSHQPAFDASEYKNIKQLAIDTEKQINVFDAKSNNSSDVGITHFLPTGRRIEGVINNIKDGNYLTATGMATLAVINLPEDYNVVKDAGSQLRSYFDKNHVHKSSYERMKYQHESSFFRGTMVEEFLHNKRNEGSRIAKTLLDADKTIDHTKFGQWVTRKLNIGEAEKVDTSIFSCSGRAAKAYSFTGTKFARLTGRAMKRVPKLAVVAMLLLEAPKLFNAAKKKENIAGKSATVAKQTLKSGLNIASITAGIAYGGAIGAKYGKGIGALIGSAVGAMAGAFGSKKIQDLTFAN